MHGLLKQVDNKRLENSDKHIFADVNRTIITPSATDQFNMMHGVLRLIVKQNQAVMNSLGP